MSFAVDTSVIIASTIAEHEHHTAAHDAMVRATHLPVACLAESWSVLTRAFGLDPVTVGQVITALAKSDRELLAATHEDYTEVFRHGAAIGLRGDIHDALIWQACRRSDVDLVTLDRRWVRRAGQPDRCRYLLDEAA
ncbi:MAG: PIN domain-containing protein [Actinophytocola sp.]|nr:PIN domain-containing protein [Actinophytocola sp.]